MTTRIQLRLKGTAEQLFDEITAKLGIPEKDAVLDALGLLHFAMTEAEKGRQIGSYDPDKQVFMSYATTALQAFKAKIAAHQRVVAEAASPAAYRAAATSDKLSR